MTSAPHESVGRIGERALIDRLTARLGDPPDWLLVGAGDDAAVLAPPRGEVEVVTTDVLIEDVHFRRAWTTASAIGHKALAVNLSDLAAMGATPRACLLSLAMPAELPLTDFDALVDGMLTLARETDTALVGGNLARSPGPLIVDVTAIGRVRRRRVLTRAGGRPGHELYVTGWLGGAAAGLAMLDAGLDRASAPPGVLACLERYERPLPRLRMGRLVARSGTASAGIDLSDGLAEAARELVRASGTGAVLSSASLPIDPAAKAWSHGVGRDPVEAALAGGEDYELLFAVPARRRRAFLAATRRCSDLPVTKVGELTREPGVLLDRDGHLEPLPQAAFGHF